ncbi:MAG: hypothetical protein FD180_2896 [Planctomycetota bacterium]|nr:MAG: hypothetical protein FD180_2896 [Planctomycetota bacterium]
MIPEDLFIFLDPDKESLMSTERRQVLDMLAQGKITPEEADRLLEKLAAPKPAEGQPAAGAAPKYLRVTVDSADGDKVNVRVPLALVRTGIKLSAMMPKEAGEKLQESGIDLSHLSSLKGEELVEALRELTVDVNSSGGDKVKVFCE